MFENYPQIVTQITDAGVALTTIVDAPWVSVTSVNGMTGDVVVQPIVEQFKPNFPYKKNNLITHNSELYVALHDFTSTNAFDPSDWNSMSVSGVDWADVLNKPTFATVATSGSYADLTNTPVIDSTLSTSSTNAVMNSTITSALGQINTTLGQKADTTDLAEVAFSGRYEDIAGTPILAAVATSGAYADLRNTPTIGNATLAIQRNGTSVGTFGANATANVTANIQVPTTTDELVNNSGFITMTDMVPLWSGLCFRSNTAPQTQSGLTWTTKRGKTLTYLLHNGGGIMQVYLGAENIDMFRQYYGARCTTSVTGDFGVHGLAQNSTIWTRLFGKENNGSATTMSEVSRTATGPTTIDGVTLYYASCADTAGTKTHIQYEVTGVRAYPGSTTWRLFGKMSAGGTLTTMSFESELTAANAGVLPCLYPRGATPSTQGATFNYLEVLEIN